MPFEETSPPASLNKESMHIAFGVDAGYVRYMGVTLTSVLENNPDIAFVFHVFTFSISKADEERLKNLAAKYGTRIDVHLIAPSHFQGFSGFSNFSQYSKAIFTRLLIPKALEKVTNRVLYLDSDIICVGSLRELRQMDLGSSIVAVVSDHAETTARRQCAALDLKHGRYFNSGVLYINIEKWITEDITRLAIEEILNRDEPLAFPDQDALNLVLDGRSTFISEKWNFRYNLEVDVIDPATMPIPPVEGVFLHFTGRVKPWQERSPREAAALFLKYQSLSPWDDRPLDAPGNYKEMRMLARALFKKGNMFGGAAWYSRYLRYKLI